MKAKKKKTKKMPIRLILIVCILACITVIAVCFYVLFGNTDETEENVVTLAKCVDGDTARFYIDGEDTTVRFLAINTPEVEGSYTEAEYYGEEASAYTCQLLSEAKTITLEYEEDDLIDKYGRTLAWVFVDGELLQEILVEEGYAEVKYIYGEYKYTELLEEAQAKAQKQALGIWSDE